MRSYVLRDRGRCSAVLLGATLMRSCMFGDRVGGGGGGGCGGRC